MPLRILALAIWLFMPLSACGFHPVYGSAGVTEAARDFFSRLRLDPVGGRLGQQFRTELENRLPVPSGSPVLAVSLLNMQRVLQPVGITLDRRIPRYNVILTATLQVTDIATGQALHNEPLRVITSYNVAQDSDFATYVAEGDATQRAVTQLAQLAENRLLAFHQQRQAGAVAGTRS